MSSYERRRYRRVKAPNVSGHLRVQDEVLALGLPIDNISMGGLFVRCDQPLPVGTPVVLELVRPGKGSMRLVGTAVASVSGQGMGVRFDALSADLERSLGGLLTELAADRSVTVLDPERSAFDFSFRSLSELPDPPQSPPEELAPPAGTVLAPPAPKRGQLDPPQRVSVPPTASNAAPASEAAPAPGPGVTLKLDESARLMVQVRGLLQDLGETQLELERRSREITALKAEVARLQGALAERDARIAELERILRGTGSGSHA